MPFGILDGYNITIPTAWINNNGGDARFDHAVIEFSGHGDFPGRGSGWKGLWVAPDATVTGFSRLRASQRSGAAADLGQRRQRSPQRAVHQLPHGRLVRGQRRRPLRLHTDGWPYVVGILRGATGAIGDNTKPNFGRRMTRDVFDFIVAYSAL